MIHLVDSVCKTFICKQHHITVFSDHKKACDAAWRYGIVKVLHDVQFYPSIFKNLVTLELELVSHFLIQKYKMKELLNLEKMGLG